MPENTLCLVQEVIKALANAQVQTWIFGGWAEELQGLRPPGLHRDIDLLYPATDFRLLEQFLQVHQDIEEIQAKRLRHKRAFLWEEVMVEVFLVEPDAVGYITDFFGSFLLLWPEDIFSHPVSVPGVDLCSVSPSALRLYRERHTGVEQARRRHFAQSGPA